METAAASCVFGRDVLSWQHCEYRCSAVSGNENPFTVRGTCALYRESKEMSLNQWFIAGPDKDDYDGFTDQQ